MLIGLCGKSGSGKSTIAKEIELLGYNRVITDTTRPPRPGERHGIDYWFDSEEMWKELWDEKQFVEHTSYKVASGDVWKYGTTVGSLDDAGENAVIILNPDGVKAFKRRGISVKIVLINANKTVLLSRLEKRGDNKDEIVRRLAADDKDFKDINKYTDYKFWNDENSDVKRLAKLIVKTVEGENNG